MTAKVPYPRQLVANETLDTLTHWRSHVRNYFRRDEKLKVFFARGTTWSQTLDNYGFQGEDRTEKADSLEGLLDTIAGFMPGPYLTARITKQTTSMGSVFDVIWEHYDVSPNPSTFLDFVVRLKPDGAQLSDMERAQITASMNKRIRLNGLAPKEVMLKRNLKNHEPVQVDDNLEGQAQYDRKVQNNAKQLIKDKLSKQIPQKPTLQIGDLIYIIADLSKSRGREQFIVTKCFVKSDVHWIVARKFQKGLRNKEYLLKADEVILAPVTDNLESVFEEDEVDFQGFQDNIILDKRDRLKNLITTLEKDTQEKRNRGRPVLPVYPDYLNALPSDVCVTEEDEVFYGFDDRDVTTSSSKRDKLQQVLKQLENPSDNGFHGFSDQEIEDAIERKTKTNRLLQETRRLVVKLRSLQPTYVKNKTLHAWNYDQWLHIMENDMFEEKSKIQQVPVDDLPSLSESIQDSSDHLSYDDEEFYSVNDITIEDVATDMLDSNVSDLEVFNTHYENIPRESTSTPNRENFKSVTDPMLLDTITVMSSSESSLESDGEEDVLIAANVKELSEAMYLPVPVGQTRVEELLNKVHQSCPELSTPEVGRVYDMSPILDGIQQFESVMQVRQHAQQESTDKKVKTQEKKKERPQRTLERPDYKLLHSHGRTQKK